MGARFAALSPSSCVSQGFIDLEAYRRAAALARDVYVATLPWDSYAKWSVGIQLIRAADSVGANIAEAIGRWHPRDRRQLLYIARASLSETQYWLIEAEKRGLLPPVYSCRVPDIRRPLNGLINRQPPS